MGRAKVRGVTIPTKAERELFGNLVRREIRGRYKGSWLGVVWTLVIPLVMMGAYTLVFNVIFRAVDNVPYYFLFVLTGLSFWTFFGGALTVSATSLIGNANLVKKVKFPREMVPIASMSSQAITMLIIVGVLMPLTLWKTPGNPAWILATPLVMVLCIAFVTGICLAFSVINVYFRDLEHIVNALLLPWFFVTPILYTYASFPLGTRHEWILTVMTYGNPVTPFILVLQDVLFWGRAPETNHVIYVFVVTLISLVGGWAIFRRLQRDLAVEL